LTEQGREKILDDAARSRFDFGGDGHTGFKVHKAVVDLHLGLIERDTRRRLGLMSGAMII
jgi:hypothetical protein